MSTVDIRLAAGPAFPDTLPQELNGMCDPGAYKEFVGALNDELKSFAAAQQSALLGMLFCGCGKIAKQREDFQIKMMKLVADDARFHTPTLEAKLVSASSTVAVQNMGQASTQTNDFFYLQIKYGEGANPSSPSPQPMTAM